MNPPRPPSQFGPEVLLVFVGHSDDAESEARIVLDCEHELQRELEQFLQVMQESPQFKTVRLWEWNEDAAARIGGQEQVVNSELDRANIAIFVFKERIGSVTWKELERCRERKNPSIPVMAFFPESAPDGKRMNNKVVAKGWADLQEKKEELTADWVDQNSKSLTPMEDYSETTHLKSLALKRLKRAIAELLQPGREVVTLPAVRPQKFLADHEHLNYDRRPVLAHAVEELDQNLIERFLQSRLSQEQTRARVRSPNTPAENLQLLGCVCDGRPTLGAFLCFAPLALLADKFDGCSLQLVVYDGTNRASSRPRLITPIGGNLLVLFEQGMEWLHTRSGLRHRGVVGSPDRDELEIPEIVLREALANAMVHRDYETPSLRDQPTRVEVYSDRVEITSFGRLPDSVSVDSLNSDGETVVPVRRNPIIARIFLHLSHVELNASGVPRMRREMERASLPPPRFRHEFHESIVRVVLLRPSDWKDDTEPAATAEAPTQPPRVFISSTASDLQEHRRAVREACLSLGMLPMMMESFPANPVGGADVCQQMLNETDVYIGIVAHRYGFIPPGQEVSLTEMEYNLAVEREIPCLMFLMHEDHPIKPRDVETGSGAARLALLKERIRKDQLTAFFKSPEDLRGHVVESLSALRDQLRLSHRARSDRAMAPADPTEYLRQLRMRSAHIEIRGLQVGIGRAHRFPIEELFVTGNTTQSTEFPGEANPSRNDRLAARETSHNSLAKALAQRCVLIIGDPGAGKTTLLRYVACTLSQTLLGEVPNAAEARLGLKEPPLPILLRISDLVEHVEESRRGNVAGRPTRPDDPGWLSHYLAAAGREPGWGLDEAFFGQRLREGRCLVMLDGLDEAPDRVARASVAKLIESLAGAYEKSTIFVTSRPAALVDEVLLPGFTHVAIDPLDDEAIRTFLSRWCEALYREIPAEATAHRDELLGALAGRPDIRRMASNPVVLTALAVVHWNERWLPEQRADLYESIIRWMSRSREQRPGRLPAERCVALLQELALAMHDHPNGRQMQVSKRWAAEVIAPELATDTRKKVSVSKQTIERAEKFLDEEENDSGLLVRRGNEIRFWHIMFQEYLAARALAARTEKEQHRLLFQRPKRLYMPEWREVVLLLGGVLHTQGRTKVDSLITAMLDDLGGRPKLADQARCAGLLGALLRDLAPLRYDVPDARYHKLLDDVLAIFDAKRARAIPIEVRMEAADALGQSGDPRIDPRSPQNWVTIPAGNFWMGAQSQDSRQPNYDRAANDDESPVHRVSLNRYRIGRYPVTVAEFDRFIESGGYDDQRYWTAGGFGEWGEPEDWEEQLAFPNRPVVGVSWFEAMSYCAWSGCRLLTEAEWERAARGTDGRMNPWGDDLADPSVLNASESRLGHATPVGLYPLGVTPEGVADMAGNVWEWCLDSYAANYYEASPSNDPRGPSTSPRRVCRGGGWTSPAKSCRAALRRSCAPCSRDHDLGFRVACGNNPIP